MQVIAAVFPCWLFCSTLSNIVSPTENRYNVTAQHLIQYGKVQFFDMRLPICTSL
jgi:hypothetical protein